MAQNPQKKELKKESNIDLADIALQAVNVAELLIPAVPPPLKVVAALDLANFARKLF